MSSRGGQAAQFILRVLKDYPDGLTAYELQNLSGGDEKFQPYFAIKRAALAMTNVYIDRWVLAKSKRWTPVFILVDVPADCPKPEQR